MVVTKPAGGWTYDDLFNLPDDGKHYEIVDGELYELPRRGSDHGLVIMNLIGLLLPIVDQLGGELFTGPLGLFLPGADPVLPDLLLLTADQLHLASRRGIEGPPALARVPKMLAGTHPPRLSAAPAIGIADPAAPEQ